MQRKILEPVWKLSPVIFFYLPQGGCATAGAGGGGAGGEGVPGGVQTHGQTSQVILPQELQEQTQCAQTPQTSSGRRDSTEMRLTRSNVR